MRSPKGTSLLVYILVGDSRPKILVALSSPFEVTKKYKDVWNNEAENTKKINKMPSMGDQVVVMGWGEIICDYNFFY